MSEFREYICSEPSGWDFGEDGKQRFKFWRGDEEVIRCRDCAYWIDADYCINPKWRVGRTCERPCTEPDGFCAWAERRKE